MKTKSLTTMLMAATAFTMVAAGAARADATEDSLQAQINLLNGRLLHLQSLQTTPPTIAPGTPAPLKKDQNGAILKFLNNPVMTYDDQTTSVHLYGLIEATLSDANHQNGKGAVAVGFQTAWAYWLSAVIGNAGIVTGVVGYVTGFVPVLGSHAVYRFAIAQLQAA